MFSKKSGMLHYTATDCSDLCGYKRALHSEGLLVTTMDHSIQAAFTKKGKCCRWNKLECILQGYQEFVEAK